MAKRREVLVNESVYHVFNKSIDRRVVFANSKFAERMVMALWYYRFAEAKASLSRYLKLNKKVKEVWFKRLTDSKLKVEILGFCLMPNHFHLLLRQVKKGGISKYVGDAVNSITRYFNLINERKGPVFLPKFKAVRVGTDEQLVHVSRYIHLNPYTSKTVDEIKDLLGYPWSSLPIYLGGEDGLAMLNQERVMGVFKNIADYKKFVLDQAGYQRELGEIKHLLFV